MNVLKITPNDNKRSVHTGLVVAAEPCDVTLVGFGGVATEDATALRIRIYVRGSEVARFPLPDTDDAWAVSGDDATCTINTNTVQALAAFGIIAGSCDPIKTRECVVVVDKTTDNKALICSFKTDFIYYPQTAGDDVPYDLSGWPDDLAAVEDSVTDLLNTYAVHDHSAGNPGVISHDNLDDIGTVSHDDIESALAALNLDMSSAEDDISTLQNEMDAVESGVGLHNHNGSGSQILAHSGLSGIGTRTHAQLETDTSAVSGSLATHKGLYNAHAHTGGDGTPKVALASVDGVAALLARLAAAESTITTLTNGLAALDSTAVKKQTTIYSVTAPTDGAYRNITDLLTGDQLARVIPTLVADLKARGIL